MRGAWRDGRDGIRPGVTEEQKRAITRGTREIVSRTVEKMDAGQSIYEIAAECGWHPLDLAKAVAPYLVKRGDLPISALDYLGRERRKKRQLDSGRRR